MQITLNVNGADYTREVEPRLLLIHFLRDDLGLTGSHWGCDTSNCGACVVWLDDIPVKSCTVLAAMADGHRVRTVEDLAAGGELDPIQQGFAECHGLQCGFCTPGMMLTARWLLDRVKAARRAQALHREHPVPVRHGREHRARLLRGVVQPHHAGPAVRRVAAPVRAGQAQVVPQEMDQQQPRLDLARVVGAVDVDGDLHVRRPGRRRPEPAPPWLGQVPGAAPGR